jgi:hypothetical protein
MKPVRVLVGCETSGRVRRAFADDAFGDQWGGIAAGLVAA